MPTYVYRCSDCDLLYERWQQMSDDADEICEECEGSVKRVLQSPQITASSMPTRKNAVPPKRHEPQWEKGRAGERRVDGSFAPYLRPADQTPMGVKEFADNRSKYEGHLRKVRSGNTG